MAKIIFTKMNRIKNINIINIKGAHRISVTPLSQEVNKRSETVN